MRLPGNSNFRVTLAPAGDLVGLLYGEVPGRGTAALAPSSRARLSYWEPGIYTLTIPKPKEYPMMSSRYSGGARAPGLFVSGLVAGALGLAISAGTGSGSPSSQSKTGAVDSTWGPFGKPTFDSSLSPSATGPSGPSGVGGSGTGAYGTGAYDTGKSGVGGSATGSTGTDASATGAPGTTGTGGTGATDATGSSAVGMTGTPLPPNVSPGWKIRVCSEKTKADNLTFRFSHGDKPKSGMQGTGGAEGTGVGGASGTGSDATAGMQEQTASWSRGESSEITVPASLRNAEKIKVEATGDKDKRSSVCVIYDDHVAKQLSFKDRDVSTVKRDASGTCGC